MFAAVQAAGTLLDMMSGFSFGPMLDPLNGAQERRLTRLYASSALAIFIAVGGDGWALRGLARTFELVPLGSARRSPASRRFDAGVRHDLRHRRSRSRRR